VSLSRNVVISLFGVEVEALEPLNVWCQGFGVGGVVKTSLHKRREFYLFLKEVGK
jgi:hypothetical protein